MRRTAAHQTKKKYLRRYLFHIGPVNYVLFYWAEDKYPHFVSITRKHAVDHEKIANLANPPLTLHRGYRQSMFTALRMFGYSPTVANPPSCITATLAPNIDVVARQVDGFGDGMRPEQRTRSAILNRSGEKPMLLIADLNQCFSYFKVSFVCMNHTQKASRGFSPLP